MVFYYRETVLVLTGSGTDIRDEINSCEVKIVLPENIPSLELFKRSAFKNGEHLCVHLNGNVFLLDRMKLLKIFFYSYI